MSDQPTTSAAQRVPEAAPCVVMDQRGNYWRLFPKETLGTDEDMWSMCPTSAENYASEPVAIYRQGRDLSMREAEAMLARIKSATDDPLLIKAAESAWYAWCGGRDMVTEAELLLQGVAIRLGVEKESV